MESKPNAIKGAHHNNTLVTIQGNNFMMRLRVCMNIRTINTKQLPFFT